MTDIIYPPCKKCGASHGMGIEERETGKITPIDICSSCLYGDVKINFDPYVTIENLSDWIK